MVLSAQQIVDSQYRATKTGLLINAPAKINLSLLIAGKRPDGFHEIETLMSKISWFDQVIVEPGQSDGIQLICGGSCWAPEGDDNLVIRAAKLISEETGFNAPLKLTLIKNIPAGTGLGSASSDGASTLLAINKYADLGLTKGQLRELASQLGSDVPFFVGGPLAMCTGRGEIIEELGGAVDFGVLIIIPNISVPTVSVYKNYRHNPEKYSSLNAVIAPLIEQNDYESVIDLCPNMLEDSCFELFGELKQLRDGISSLIGQQIHMSGSGSALFSIIRKDWSEEVAEIQKKIHENFSCQSVVVNNNRW